MFYALNSSILIKTVRICEKLSNKHLGKNSLSVDVIHLLNN